MVTNTQKIQMVITDMTMLMEVTNIQLKKVTTDTIMLITATGMNTTTTLQLEPTPTQTALVRPTKAHTHLIMETIEKTSQVFLTFIDSYFMYYFKW